MRVSRWHTLMAISYRERGRREREKESDSSELSEGEKGQDEEGLAPKKRVTGYVIPATALLFLAPEARARYPGRERIYGGAQDEHTHLRWAEQRYITRAPRDTSPAGSLPLSSVSPSAGLSTSPFLLLSLIALSRFAFPRGWIAARGYVRNRGTKCVRGANSSPLQRS